MRISRSTTRARSVVEAGAAIALGTTLLVSGCEQTNTRVRNGPLTFEIELVDGDIGTTPEPRAFASAHALTLNVRAIAFDGSVAADFNDSVRVSLAPNGRFAFGTQTELQLVDGLAQGVQFEFERAHGDVHLWFEHAGDAESPGSFATGLSPTVHVSRPTIREAQDITAIGDVETSNLEFDQVRFLTEGRTIVATGTTQDGFYATDVTDPSFGSIFVFTFSEPAGVEVGSKIVELSGALEEFFGLTELGFPSYKVDGTAPVPDPVWIRDTDVGDDIYMESLEAALVEIRDVTVCPTGTDYSAFGQWTAKLNPSANCQGGAGVITILSAQTVPGFDPTAATDQVLPVIRGNLRFHVAANPPWILYPRDEEDLIE
jgi:hypothetical protein